MALQTIYFFSKRSFLFTSLFILSFSAGIIYISSIFYPGAWQYSVLFAIPLLVVVYILPEYIRTCYFLVTKKPAIILTEYELIDNFNGKSYKWSAIKRICIRPNQGRAPGSHIAICFYNSDEIIQISDIKLKGEKSDILKCIIKYHKKYFKKDPKEKI